MLSAVKPAAFTFVSHDSLFCLPLLFVQLLHVVAVVAFVSVTAVAPAVAFLIVATVFRLLLVLLVVLCCWCRWQWWVGSVFPPAIPLLRSRADGHAKHLCKDDQQGTGGCRRAKQFLGTGWVGKNYWLHLINHCFVMVPWLMEKATDYIWLQGIIMNIDDAWCLSWVFHFLDALPVLCWDALCESWQIRWMESYASFNWLYLTCDMCLSCVIKTLCLCRESRCKLFVNKS